MTIYEHMASQWVSIECNLICVYHQNRLSKTYLMVEWLGFMKLSVIHKKYIFGQVFTMFRFIFQRVFDLINVWLG